MKDLGLRLLNLIIDTMYVSVSFVILYNSFDHFRAAQSEQFWRRKNKSGKDEESSRYYLEYQKIERERMATQTQRPDSGSLFRYTYINTFINK